MQNFSEQFDILHANIESTVEKYGTMIGEQENTLHAFESAVKTNKVNHDEELENMKVSIADMAGSLQGKVQEENRLLVDNIVKKEAERKEEREIILENINTILNKHDHILNDIDKTNRNNEMNLTKFSELTENEFGILSETLMNNDKDDKELQEKVDKCQIQAKYIDESFTKSVKEAQSEIQIFKQQHIQLLTEIGIANEKTQQDLCLIKNKIGENAEESNRLRKLMKNHKTQVENQNTFNKNCQIKIKEQLKEISQTDKLMKSEIKAIKNDIKENESSRKMREKELTKDVQKAFNLQTSNAENLKNMQTTLKDMDDNIACDKLHFDEDLQKSKIKLKENAKFMEENMQMCKENIEQAKTEMQSGLLKQVEKVRDMTKDGLHTISSKVGTLVNGDIANTSRRGNIQINYIFFLFHQLQITTNLMIISIFLASAGF